MGARSAAMAGDGRMTERDAPFIPALLLIGIGFGAMISTFISVPGALFLAGVTTVIGFALLFLGWRG